jgi:hypothetical protein
MSTFNHLSKLPFSPFLLMVRRLNPHPPQNPTPPLRLSLGYALGTQPSELQPSNKGLDKALPFVKHEARLYESKTYIDHKAKEEEEEGSCTIHKAHG